MVRILGCDWSPSGADYPGDIGGQAPEAPDVRCRVVMAPLSQLSGLRATSAHIRIQAPDSGAPRQMTMATLSFR